MMMMMMMMMMMVMMAVVVKVKEVVMVAMVRTSVEDREVIACALAHSVCSIMLGSSTLAAGALMNCFIETINTPPCSPIVNRNRDN
jgi:hypothetical protein